MNKMTLGLTGTIGAGKSTVSLFLEQQGFVIINVDKVGHKLLQDETIQAMLVSEFGEDVFKCGAIDRTILARKAFSTAETLKSLNALIHPSLTKRVISEAQHHRRTVIDAALLFELNLHTICNFCWFVDAPKQQRQNRLGADKKNFLQREQYQEPYQFKRETCHEIITNDGSLNTLHTRILALLEEKK